jgi:hypothetical protein
VHHDGEFLDDVTVDGEVELDEVRVDVAVVYVFERSEARRDGLEGNSSIRRTING